MRIGSNHDGRAVQWAIQRLIKLLCRQYQALLAELAYRPADPDQVEALAEVALRYSQMIAGLGKLLQDPDNLEPALALAALECMAERVGRDLAKTPAPGFTARRAWIAALDLLSRAEESVSQVSPDSGLGKPKVVILPSDLLYQISAALFPAERMLVAAGRRCGSVVTLGAVFDVTGRSSAGHVSADANALGRALIAMDLSNTFLAAWLHSHPGRGQAATCPSALDFQQHQDWIRDYSPDLVSAILVEDGWARFWGTGLESGRVALEVSGGGVQKEAEHEWIYRIDR